MKYFLKGLMAFAVAMLFAAPAIAQTYPYNTPTYIPNARVLNTAATSGVAGTAVKMNGINTLGVQITGTCTNLAATIQGSGDGGTTWYTLNLYPNAATSSASAVTSVSATGNWFANVAGVDQVRINPTAVTGTACKVSFIGSPGAFALPR